METIISPTLNPARVVYTISQLNQAARALLEDNFSLIWIEGEISNLARPASGHLYFSLKDANAQVRCAMFQMRNRLINFKIENGMQVLARAKVSLYEGRGDFQLIVEQVEEAGDGALRRAFELLKQKLAAEGLFDSAHKQLLPALPKCIGVVTSPTGAAIRDILAVLNRRCPSIPIIIYPTAVQGTNASNQIVQAIQLANARQECDVLIVARGGGSLEDLWSFNEENVARAIFASTIPIVSGVGHEIDFTIADFVADHRAPTPSAAAELISPASFEWQQSLQRLKQTFIKLIDSYLEQQQQKLLWLEKRLQHPGRRLQDYTQRLDEYSLILQRAQLNLLKHKRAQLNELSGQLRQHTPQHFIDRSYLSLITLQQRLHQKMEWILLNNKQRFALACQALETLSPLATLNRGYAIAIKKTDQKIIRSIQDLTVGENITIQIADGFLDSTVNSIQPKSSAT